MADADAVRQIVAVLLDNAAKYAAAGGPVEVSSGVSGDGRASLSVADRGAGLTSEALRHVFDRFWRGDDATTAETGGSGLGLAIARELALGMKGDLSVARRNGGGLVFKLTLPCAGAESL
jgi:signal transduction histidine kinase